MAKKIILIMEDNTKKMKLLSTQAGYRDMLNNLRRSCLVFVTTTTTRNGNNDEQQQQQIDIEDYESLEDGQTYILGDVLQQQQQPNDADISDLAEYVRNVKQDSGTLVLSNITVDKYTNVCQTLGLTIKGAHWETLPQLGDQRIIPVFPWRDGKENSIVNRTAYMAHLREHFAWPDGWTLVDGEDHGNLLSIPRLINNEFKTSGNVDVIIASNVNVENEALKSNIEAQIELKKDTNVENPEKQVVMQHLAASNLNPQFGVLTVMTNLHDKWHFYWFSSRERAALMKVVAATRHHAFYLLEHMFDDAPAANETAKLFPVDFLSRGSWNKCIGLGSISQENVGDGGGHSMESSSTNEGEDGGADRGLSRGVSGPSQSQQQTGPSASKRSKGGDKGGHGHTQHTMSLDFGNDVANELDLLDFMDEEERSAELFRLIVANEVPRMVT